MDLLNPFSGAVAPLKRVISWVGSNGKIGLLLLLAVFYLLCHAIDCFSSTMPHCRATLPYSQLTME